MADYKLQFIQSTEESLAFILDNETREKVIDLITRNLREYEVVKAETALVEYQGVNETLLKKYCACLLIGGKSKKTIAQYKRTAEKLFQAVQKNFTDMDVYDIRLFLAIEKQRGVSNRTLENTRANLSAFFQWLHQEDLIPKNPCSNISPIKYTDKVRLPFSSVEIDALRFACKNEKERAIIELLLSSGVRVSELTGMKVQDIDFQKMSVHVTNRKGSKERTTFMNDLARKHLQTYLSERGIFGEYLFYNKQGTPLNPGGVRHLLNEIGKRATVDNVHPHRFRRTFASGMADRGMNIQEIRKLLGHTNINTTLEYVYTSDEQIHSSYMKYSA